MLLKVGVGLLTNSFNHLVLLGLQYVVCGRVVSFAYFVLQLGGMVFIFLNKDSVLCCIYQNLGTVYIRMHALYYAIYMSI